MTKYAFFDVDHTIYNGYLCTDFCEFLVEKGYAGADIRLANEELLDQYVAGVIDYREASARALQLFADAIKGRTDKEVAKFQEEFAETKGEFFPWVEELMEILRASEFSVYLVSAAPTIAIEAIAQKLGVNHFYGTELVIDSGVYVGELATVLNFEQKHLLIQKLLDQMGRGFHLGFGDSMGDVDMLSALDEAILYKPKPPELIEIAQKNGWKIADEATMITLVRAVTARVA